MKIVNNDFIVNLKLFNGPRGILYVLFTGLINSDRDLDLPQKIILLDLFSIGFPKLLLPQLQRVGLQLSFL